MEKCELFYCKNRFCPRTFGGHCITGSNYVPGVKIGSAPGLQALYRVTLRNLQYLFLWNHLMKSYHIWHIVSSRGPLQCFSATLKTQVSCPGSSGPSCFRCGKWFFSYDKNCATSQGSGKS
ncbi:hypothetical protein ACF0H5_007832 [Mactra antiquata]